MSAAVNSFVDGGDVHVEVRGLVHQGQAGSIETACFFDLSIGQLADVWAAGDAGPFQVLKKRAAVHVELQAEHSDVCPVQGGF